MPELIYLPSVNIFLLTLGMFIEASAKNHNARKRVIQLMIENVQLIIENVQLILENGWKQVIQLIKAINPRTTWSHLGVSTKQVAQASNEPTTTRIVCMTTLSRYEKGIFDLNVFFPDKKNDSKTLVHIWKVNTGWAFVDTRTDRLSFDCSSAALIDSRQISEINK